jgi:hypothetical protein
MRSSAYHDANSDDFQPLLRKDRIMMLSHSRRMQNLQPVSKLTATNAARGNFGSSVAISTNLVAVGAAGDAAYVFRKNGTANEETGQQYYTQIAVLIGSDGPYDWFAKQLDIYEDMIIVGSAGYHDTETGAAYIFHIGEDDEVSQITKLTASDGGVGDRFGISVAIEGNLVTWEQITRNPHTFTWTSMETESGQN